MAQWIYEMSGGQPYGYFSGKYLYTSDGKCTHYRGGSDEKYLYTMNGQAEFYQKGKYFYTMNGSCRWYLG